jgi:hypothetical protein
MYICPFVPYNRSKKASHNLHGENCTNLPISPSRMFPKQKISTKELLAGGRFMRGLLLARERQMRRYPLVC